MIPYDIDPSLHAAAPPPERLEDGFAPRAIAMPPDEVVERPSGETSPEVDAAWQVPSAF